MHSLVIGLICANVLILVVNGIQLWRLRKAAEFYRALLKYQKNVMNLHRRRVDQMQDAQQYEISGTPRQSE